MPPSNAKAALSIRELQIVQMAAAGLTDKEICSRLRLSASTVRSYWTRIRMKFNAVNRCHAVALCCGAQLTGLGDNVL